MRPLEGLLVLDFSQLEAMKSKVEGLVGSDLQPDGSALRTSTIKEKNTQLFDWLTLTNMNAWIILTLMVMVAAFNMISSLMILILERTNMIGLLTSLGANSISVRKIFLYQSGFLLLKGLLWGNIIGIGICLLQYHFKFIKLDQATYFISSVPVNFNLLHLFLLNIGTLAITMLMLIIPSMIISKISPDSTLRYN